MSGSSDPILAPRVRALLYLCDGCIVLACAALAALVEKHWRWGPFLLGLLLAIAGLGVNVLVLRAGIAAIRPDPDGLQRARSFLRGRTVQVIVPAYVSFGVAFGLIAGSMRSYWPDAALGSLILVFGAALPLAMLPVMRRRADALRQRAAGPAA